MRVPQKIFLTFDDGPDPTWTPRVLEALRTARARATFFVIAPLARRTPHLLEEMVRDGHTVGLHCVRHVRHTELDPQGLAADVQGGLRDLHGLGLHPTLWRPPWGVIAPWSWRVAREHRLDLVTWTSDTHDWRGDAAPEMLAAIAPELGPGTIVLMHDGLGPGARREDCAQTVALLVDLVERIRAIGCEPAALEAAEHPTPARGALS